MKCCLTARDGHRFQTTFQLSNPLLQDGVGRIADPAVAVAVGFEVEQGCAVVGAIERVRNGLVDRDRHGPSGWINLVAAVNGDGFAFHAVASTLLARFPAPDDAIR